MRTWINGRLLEDPSGPAIAVNDHGFTVGDGVFEVVKVIDGKPFAMSRHLERMARSAKGLGLPPVAAKEVLRGVEAVLESDPLPRGRVRITYTGGAAPLGSDRGDEATTLVVAAEALGPWPGPTAVVTVPWPRNERGALAGVKSTSYAENVVALAYAHERGASEAIFPNLAGNLCEGTGSNVFYVVAGELRTPTLESGCLAGISRALLLEWYGGHEIDEALAVLDEASEIFLVSTTRDVQPVTRCDGRDVEAPGPLTREAMTAWAKAEQANTDP